MVKPESRATETMVGLFVLLGLAVISVLVFAIAGKQKLFEPRYRLTARFANVAGLKVGSPIRLAGLEVGRVESLSFTPEGEVLAMLSLQTRYEKQIRNDSVATISSVGILGDKSVEITIGSKRMGYLRSGGAILTKEPFDVSQFVDQVGPMAAKVDEILSYLSKVTGEFSMEDFHFAETVDHANAILKKIEKGQGTLGATVNDPTLYKEAVSFVREGKETAEGLQKALDRVESASVGLPSLIASTRQTMEDISVMSQNLRDGAKQFPMIAERVGEAAENARIASRDLPAMAGAFRRASENADDVMKAAKRSWFIEGNLPERPSSEERIFLDDSSFSYEETGP